MVAELPTKSKDARRVVCIVEIAFLSEYDGAQLFYLSESGILHFVRTFTFFAGLQAVKGQRDCKTLRSAQHDNRNHSFGGNLIDNRLCSSSSDGGYLSCCGSLSREDAQVPNVGF